MPEAVKDQSSAPSRLVRFLVLICVLLLLSWAGMHVRDALDEHITPPSGEVMFAAMVVFAVAYVGLLSLPFVPGAEIGFAMLAVFGTKVAPLVYVATVFALMLAFVVGRLLPVSALERLLRALQLRRAASLVAEAAPLCRDERIALLLGDDPHRYSSLALRFRYLALAVAVNAPGNSLVGGGGGIMMMAGLSGLFCPMMTLLTVALAVAPVPLIVGLMGLYGA